MARITKNSAPEPTEPDEPTTPGAKDPGARVPGAKASDAKVPDTKVLPTEQLEFAPSPVSARTAASGGATGLSDVSGNGASGTGAFDEAATGTATPRENLTVFRRHPVASGIVAGIIAVVVVSSLTAWGVGAAVTASLINQTAPITTPSTATPAPGADGQQGGPLAAGRVAFRATIQGIDDSTWTILTKRGQTVSVAITSSTQFGTKRMSETQGSFAVGDSVVIVANRTNGTATAVRVVTAQGIGSGTGSGNTGNDTNQPTPTPSPTSSATT